MFDEEPDGDQHGLCALEIRRLGALVIGYRKVLWVLARREGLSLSVHRGKLAAIPAEAELLQWEEDLFDSVMFKGICSPLNQPDLAKRLDVP